MLVLSCVCLSDHVLQICLVQDANLHMENTLSSFKFESSGCFLFVHRKAFVKAQKSIHCFLLNPSDESIIPFNCMKHSFKSSVLSYYLLLENWSFTLNQFQALKYITCMRKRTVIPFFRYIDHSNPRADVFYVIWGWKPVKS